MMHKFYIRSIYIFIVGIWNSKLGLVIFVIFVHWFFVHVVATSLFGFRDHLRSTYEQQTLQKIAKG